MIELEHAKLKEILKKINTNPQTRQQYSSKLYRILNFLNSNTGLKNAAVKDAGSRAKQTETWNSDLDVIFCTSTNEDHQKIRKHILVKAKEGSAMPKFCDAEKELMELFKKSGALK